MKSKYSVEEKFEIVIEALTKKFPTQLAKWKEQFIQDNKDGKKSNKAIF